MWNLSKLNNKDTTTASLVLVSLLSTLNRTDFKHCSVILMFQPSLTIDPSASWKVYSGTVSPQHHRGGKNCFI